LSAWTELGQRPTTQSIPLGHFRADSPLATPADFAGGPVAGGARGPSVSRASFLSRGLQVRTPTAVDILDHGRDGTGLVSTRPLCDVPPQQNSED